MPLVFGGAPIVNVLVSMAFNPPKDAVNPMLYAGLFLGRRRRGYGVVLPGRSLSLNSVVLAALDSLLQSIREGRL